MFEVAPTTTGNWGVLVCGNVPVHVPVVGQPLLKPAGALAFSVVSQPGTQLAGSVRLQPVAGRTVVPM